MSSSSMQTLSFLVNVPALDGRGRTVPQGAIRFINPGVAGLDNDGLFLRPETLPMDEPVVAAMLAQYAPLARESRGVADISAFAPGQYEDFHSGTSFAIRDAITAQASGQAGAIRAREMRSKAQTTLCLAWALEQAGRELAGLEEKLGGQWSRFEQSLGWEEDDALDPEALTLAQAKPQLAPGGPKVPYGLLVDAVLCFLPEGCGLFSDDAALAEEWREYGVAFAPATDADTARFGLEGAWQCAKAPGHLLCLSRRAAPDKPWQAAAWSVFLPAGDRA